MKPVDAIISKNPNKRWQQAQGIYDSWNEYPMYRWYSSLESYADEFIRNNEYDFTAQEFLHIVPMLESNAIK